MQRTPKLLLAIDQSEEQVRALIAKRPDLRLDPDQLQPLNESYAEYFRSFPIKEEQGGGFRRMSSLPSHQVDWNAMMEDVLGRRLWFRYVEGRASAKEVKEAEEKLVRELVPDYVILEDGGIDLHQTFAHLPGPVSLAQFFLRLTSDVSSSQLQLTVYGVSEKTPEQLAG